MERVVLRDAEDIMMLLVFFWAMYLLVTGCKDEHRREQMRTAVHASGRFLRESVALPCSDPSTAALVDKRHSRNKKMCSTRITLPSVQHDQQQRQQSCPKG